ncbi:hypothetical protein CTA1_1613 [Colletotrichum tanaceti]|uniref:Uncharacterized protein n=1 Tax=Colletotrichum tanaceti TaxID=1306861 RepID=A0A4U6XCL3_9PEZI|nr:hypothetical protein CTA1_1613 [Colletotrichum tanaceti]
MLSAPGSSRSRPTIKRLLKPLAGKRLNAVAEEDDPAEAFVNITAAEASGPKGTADAEDVQIERKVREYIPWMVAHLEGFVPAFMSCARWAPLTGISIHRHYSIAIFKVVCLYLSNGSCAAF